MKTKDKLSNIVTDKGYLFAKDVKENNISYTKLNEYIKYNGYEKVAHGIYVSKNTFLDYYFILCERNKRIVFSLESALFLNDLMEKESDKVTVCIPRGYNASHLRQKNIRVISKEKEIYELGITTIKTNLGNEVKVYDIDKTICDLIKNKSKFDIQVFKYALNEYIKRKDKNLINLINYSKVMKIENEIRSYIEVLM